MGQQFTRWVRWVAVLFGLFGTAVANAHQAEISYVHLSCEQHRLAFRVTLDPHVTPLSSRMDLDSDGTLTAPEVMAQDTAMQAFIVGRVQAKTDDGDCVRDDTRTASSYLPDLMMWQLDVAYSCPTLASEATVALTFVDDLPHTHRVLVKHQDGSRFATITLQRPNVLVPRLVARSTFATVKLGIEHILEGWDHLAFVGLLVMSAATLAQAIWVLTTFTIAHSITLVLAVFGWIQLPTRWVEAAIALSIVVLALLQLLQSLRHRRMQSKVQSRALRLHMAVVLAFVCGLLHGLGFAAALRQALSENELVTSLLGFNLGVEIGQSAVVLLLWPMVMRLPQFGRVIVQTALMLLGFYWLFERLQ